MQELFTEITESEASIVSGGTYGSTEGTGLIVINRPVIDNSNGNIQGQGIGGQLNDSPVPLNLLNGGSPLDIIGGKGLGLGGLVGL